jgi:hypothetical protein
MSQVNNDDIDRILAEFSKFAPAMDSYLRSLKAREKAETKASKESIDRIQEYDSKIWKANKSLEGFIRGTDAGIAHFTKTMLAPLGSAAFMGIAAFTALWGAGSKLNETWREMTEIGQTFGGSMFAMQQAANNAGMPLETFARLQKAHNFTINATGKTYWAVNRQLRENLRVSGQYGMSMEQLGDFTASYMEVFRRNGSLQNSSTGEVTSTMQDLALTTTALAKASDKTRERITELATSALNSALAFGGMAQIPLAVRNSATKSIAEATAAFAALPGTAGEYFSRFFTDSLGTNSALTDGGQVAIEAGMSDLASQMDAVALKFRAGQGSIDDQIDIQNKFVDSVNSNIGNLTALAAGGNSAARQMIELASQMKKTSRGELERAKDEAKKTEAITAFMASVEDIFASLKATFGSAFIKAFGDSFDGFNNFANSPAIKAVQQLLETLGTRLGHFLGTALTEANISKLASGLESVVTGLFNFFNGIANAQPIWTVLGTALSVISKSIGAVVYWFDKLGATGQKLVGGFLGALLLFKGVKSLFGKMFGSNMVVNAQTVIVNGDEGGAGVGGAAGKGGVKGMLRRAARGARAGRRLGGVRGGLAGGLRGLRGIGGVAGRAGGAMGVLGRAAPWLGVGLEGLDYATGEKSLSWRNVAKSGLALGGGALGALGMGAVSGGIGSIAGGMGGYAGGKALGDWMLGPDTPIANAMAASSKAATATAAAASSIAASNEAMKQATGKDTEEEKPVTDPIQMLLDEIKGLRQDVRRGNSVNVAKLDNAVRLLSKIEVSAQSL